MCGEEIAHQISSVNVGMVIGVMDCIPAYHKCEYDGCIKVHRDLCWHKKDDEIEYCSKCQTK